MTSSSPFRRAGATLALVPVAVLWSAVAGFGLGWHGPDDGWSILRDLSEGRGTGGLALVSFLAFLLTGAVLGLGQLRSRPFHALKACAVLGTALFPAFWLLGRLAHEQAG